MPELPMAAAGADQAPTIAIKDSEKLADLQATDDTALPAAGAGPKRRASPTSARGDRRLEFEAASSSAARAITGDVQPPLPARVLYRTGESRCSRPLPATRRVRLARSHLWQGRWTGAHEPPAPFVTSTISLRGTGARRMKSNNPLRGAAAPAQPRGARRITSRPTPRAPAVCATSRSPLHGLELTRFLGHLTMLGRSHDEEAGTKGI
jgi:hypothetical protein